MRLLSSGEVARVLGVSRERVLQLVAAGRLRPAALDGYGRRMFDPVEVEQLARERSRRPRGGSGAERR